MKWHKEITSEEGPVYDWRKVKFLVDDKKPHTLSRWKQENIRMAIKEGASAVELFDALQQECGYCWACIACPYCTLYKKLGKRCNALPEWDNMASALTRKAFAEAHEAWCKKLGLWGKNWE